MKNRKKKKQLDISEIFGREFTYVYLLVMFGLFPVFYPGHLIGIHSVKSSFYTIASAIYLCLLAIPLANQIILCFKQHRITKPGIIDSFAVLFLASVLISTLVSLNRTNAVYGNDNIKTGAIVLALCGVTYFTVRKYAKCDRILVLVNLAASAFIYLSGIFLTCQMDIFNMQKNIIDAQKGMFVSPIGNVDFNVSYISLMLPAAMVLFLLCKEAMLRYLMAASVFLGFMDCFCLRTESSIILMAFLLLLLFYFALEKEEWLNRFIMIVLLFLAANISIFFLRNILKVPMYPFSGFSLYLLRTETVLIEAVLFALLFWVWKRNKLPKTEKLLQIQKIYKWVCLVLAAAGILWILILNLFLKEQMTGTAWNWLLLSDSMFSHRGFIWIRTIKEWKELPLVNQIFGCGAGCYIDFIYPTYGTEMMNVFSASFYEPHSDFLQVLVTTGIAGVIGYFGMIFGTLVIAFRKRKERNMQIIVIMVLAAYLLQGLVNSYTIFVIPLVFLILGMAESETVAEEAFE